MTKEEEELMKALDGQGAGLQAEIERLSDSSPVAGSVSDDENQDWMLETGLWVKSKTTGRLYAPKHIPDSDIDCIIVDGAWFERSE